MTNYMTNCFLMEQLAITALLFKNKFQFKIIDKKDNGEI